MDLNYFHVYSPRRKKLNVSQQKPCQGQWRKYCHPFVLLQCKDPAALCGIEDDLAAVSHAVTLAMAIPAVEKVIKSLKIGDLIPRAS